MPNEANICLFEVAQLVMDSITKVKETKLPVFIRIVDDGSKIRVTPFDKMAAIHIQNFIEEQSNDKI